MHVPVPSHVRTAVFLLTMAPVAVGQANGFSLDQVLNSPFPSSLVATVVGSRIAWVFHSQGSYSIWTADTAGDLDGYKAKMLHSFPADDGRSISLLGFLPEGRSLIYRRGGSALYRISVAGGSPEKILGGSSAVISPQDDRIAYVRGGEVYQLRLDKKPLAEKRLAKLLGSVSQLHWSPDAEKLAMRITRASFDEDYSWITVLDLQTKKLSYLDASIYQDSSPRWSPEGKRIAFLRRLTPGSERGLMARELVDSDPWEVRVVDVEGGPSVSWLRSPEPHAYAHASIDWRTNDRIVFRSERGGWLRLWEVTERRRSPRALSPARAEVESFTIAPEGKLYFTSNANDIDRRHLWVAKSRRRGEPLTSGPSIEWNATPTADGRFVAHFASDARQPAHVWVRSADGIQAKKLAAQTLPKDFPLEQLVTPEQVILTAKDKVSVHAQLFRPPARYRGRRPAVMFFHGGPVRQMLLGWHHRSYYHRAYAFNQYLASRGYYVLSVNYRLGIGYGRAFREVPGGGPRGASEYQDLLAGAAWLRQQEGIDPERIGLWGGSYGGYLTALGLARSSDLFAAGVDFHGVHDWNLWQAWTRNRKGNAKPERADNRTAWKSSPLADLDSWRSPVLLIHGDDDHNVPFAETMWLARELQRRKVPHELLVIPDEQHSFRLHQSWLKAYSKAAEFFDRKLRDKVTRWTPVREGPGRYEFDLGSEVLEVFTYKPKTYGGERMIMVMHGTLRNADEYRDHAQAMGERFGALIVAPRFDRERFPSRRYHQGGILRSDGGAAPPSEWTYPMIPKLAGLVRMMEGKPKLLFWIIGHSAGGQFVARMSAFQVTGAERHVAANPGSHLFPTKDMPFAYGFGELPRELSDDRALRRYLQAPLTFYLGTQDNKPDRYFSRGPVAMQQGGGRLQRGRNCYQMGRELAERNGWTFNWRIVRAEDIGHDHQLMFDHPSCRKALFGK